MNRFEPPEKMTLEVDDEKFSFSFSHNGQVFAARNIRSRDDLVNSILGWMQRGEINKEILDKVFYTWNQIPCVDNLIRGWDDC